MNVTFHMGGHGRLVARARTTRGWGTQVIAGNISTRDLVKLLNEDPIMRRELCALLMLEEVKCERKAQSA